MTAYRYAIVRLVPDPLREEFVNVGVVVAPKDGPPAVRIMTTSDAKAYSLTHVVDSHETIESLRDNVRRWGPDGLRYLDQASTDWAGTIQFSTVRGTRGQDPGRIADQLYEEFVARSLPPPPARVVTQTRPQVRNLVVKRLLEVFPRDLVRKNPPPVPGKLEPHKFDASIQNGKLLHAVTTLSFEIKTASTIKGELEAAAYAMYDVREMNPGLPLSLVALGDQHPKMLTRARGICASLDVEVVAGHSIDTWAKRVRKDLDNHLPQPELEV